jgi:hypothetical protein
MAAYNLYAAVDVSLLTLGSSDHPYQKGNDSDHQQRMDQTSRAVIEYTEQPSNNEDHGDQI